MASINKRGTKQWNVRIRRKGYPLQTATFEKREDAETWARDVESKMDKGAFLCTKEAERTSLHEALDRYIKEYAPSLADHQREVNRAKFLQKRKIAQMSLAKVRGMDIAAFIKEREAEGVAGNTIRLDLATFSRLFETARKDWGMEYLDNPVKKARKPKISRGRERRLQDGEEEKLLKHAPEGFRPIIQFALETAMRRGEIASLRWENVKLKESTLFLPKTKNGAARTVPLSPAALNVLKELPRDIKGSVFRLTPDEITQAMKKARAGAKLKNLRFHDLRHEAVSRLFEKTNLDIMQIQMITGHKTLQMLARYTHLRAVDLVKSLASNT
ncbi:site-specific integrase [Desulfovibrio sp. Huiquan2017]|uniref:tyrosine-type recombinase/integrase n=1 Tax=Desulfovibrio sp. Huiquan2017 TaxID=2816861 RepID=UPI001A92B06D|nr:site-specific integrase [Desulfovibrio sp. Huiquan2017]